MRYLKIYEEFDKDKLDIIAYKYADNNNIVISKCLNPQYSLGKVFLTNNNRLVKVTESSGEYIISKNLIKHPHKNFPIIYDIKKIGNLYLIYKEYIEPLNNKDIKEYNKLFQEIDEIISMEYADNDYDLPYNSDSYLDFYKIRDVVEEYTYFVDYLSDEKPELMNLYNQLVSIYKYSNNLVNNNAIDLHLDNLGKRGIDLVLFDF